MCWVSQAENAYKRAKKDAKSVLYEEKRAAVRRTLALQPLRQVRTSKLSSTSQPWA